MNGVKIRPEKARDYEGITKVNDEAFKGQKESILVKRLRKRSEFNSKLSLVAVYNDEIVGHILFFPVKIGTYVSLLLAPLAVLPRYQKHGIGAALVREGLKKAREEGLTSVIVVGHPDYYPQFEFKKASTFNLKCPFEVPDEAFMAIELVSAALAGVKGTIQFPQEVLDCV